MTAIPTRVRYLRWSLGNVLVAGRRMSGEAWGRDEKEALRRFVARSAKELGADVRAALVCAQRDPFKRVSIRPADHNQNQPTGGNQP